MVPDAGNDLKINIAPNMNNNIKQNAIQQDPEQFFNPFVADYVRRAEEKIAQLKTGKEGRWTKTFKCPTNWVELLKY